MTLYLFLFLIFVFLLLYFRLHLFLFPKNRLIILMYHQVEKKSTDSLTVSLDNLEKQFKYLKDKNYSSKFFSDINIPTKKSIIITFDDGYKNNFDHLPLLLEKYNLKAVIFIPTKFIQEGYNNHPMMTFDDIRKLDPNYFEIALHTHIHENLRTLSPEAIEKDLEANMQILNHHHINYKKVLAYPYGKYPKRKKDRKIFFMVLEKLGIDFAVRIGNRVNYYPSKKYELCRIDIKGDDSIEKFKLKLIFGKLKLF
ncbi:polysaccharide deacetylase family protein [Chryseobacterium paridis]|uniref:Polysaccharide deacetylase family protein n=1 Tax=Chryseobacterium paridis TaxID=2800328 RepID=A0ABS1G0L4_9FLAO|nr:polysaccharide deacetylase family protein [Chryseobacterium paridis]MBK1898199.1 polysaccharide deacetylase family protein [Chryseobacterium paridis]